MLMSTKTVALKENTFRTGKAQGYKNKMIGSKSWLWSSLMGCILTLMMAPSVTQADGSFVGVGIVIQEFRQGFQIIEVMENSPASQAQIFPGEWILAVDGNSTKSKSLAEVVAWVRGNSEIGTRVTLTLSSGDSTRDVTLTREVIQYRCFMEGIVNLVFYHYGNGNGSINGSIGGHGVYWIVSSGYVSGGYKGAFINMRLDGNVQGDLRLSGWIRGTFVTWYGYGFRLNSFQSCIR